MSRRAVPVKERLIKKREISITNCWLANGYIEKSGYAKIKINGFLYYIHRVSFEEFVRPLLKDEQVNHIRSCPNRHCFNPEHLYAGDQSDNMKDMQASDNNCLGENHTCSKTSNSDVEVARNLYASEKATQSELAKMFGVSQATVSRWIRGINRGNDERD